MISEEISQVMRELYETTENDFTLKVQLALKKGATKDSLLKQLKVSQRKADSLLNKVTDRASKLSKTDLKAVEDKNKKMNSELVRSALREFDLGKITIKSLTKSLGLKGAIYRQTQNGISKGLNVKVNGRNYGYKEYMEMSVRTTIANEIGSQQLDSGKNAKVVFYITNVFADCADDHKDYQGKMYFDNRYKSYGLDNDVIEGIINQKKMKSIQWVREKPVYFTTRPNCRHTFTPISIEQARGSAKSLVSGLKLSSGTYKTKNYKDTQKQRYNERMIRSYKARAENNQALGYDNTRDKQLVSAWQKRNRELIKQNPTLERDYRRETRKVLLTDLGAKYNV